MNKVDYSVFYEEKSLEFVTHICVFTITDVSCDYCSPFSNPFLLTGRSLTEISRNA